MTCAAVMSLLSAACAAVQSPAPVAEVGSTGKRVAPVKAERFESEEFIVVIAGPEDTVESLAARFLGDPAKAWMIEDYNGVRALSAGQQVVIPKRFWNLSGVYASGYQLVPILVYHNLAPQAKGRMTIAANRFEEQMRFLKAHGFRVVSLKEFVEFASLKRQLPQKSIVLSFDDGYKSFLTHAYPILKELGFTATLFVYTDYIGAGRNALTWTELRKLSEEGFQIEAHSKSHADLRRAAGEPAEEYGRRIAVELNQPREVFLKQMGRHPETLAYPFGRQDDGVVQRAKDRGYVAAFTVRRQGSPSFVEPLRIHRSQIYSEMSLEDFIKNLDIFSKEALR
jgi:peptidoglycan/xylan/chitin deacetylase (PgdA/CDA1 family)